MDSRNGYSSSLKVNRLLTISSIHDVNNYFKLDYNRLDVLNNSSKLLNTLVMNGSSNRNKNGKDKEEDDNEREFNFSKIIMDRDRVSTDLSTDIISTDKIYKIKDDILKFQNIITNESNNQIAKGNYIISSKLKSKNNILKKSLINSLQTTKLLNHNKEKEKLHTAQLDIITNTKIKLENDMKNALKNTPDKKDALKLFQQAEADALERNLKKEPIFRVSKIVIDNRKLEHEALKAEDFELALKYRVLHQKFEKEELIEHDKKVSEWREKRREQLKHRHKLEEIHLTQQLSDLKLREERKKQASEEILNKNIAIQSQLMEHAQYLEKIKRVETSVRPIVADRTNVSTSSSFLGSKLLNNIRSQSKLDENRPISATPIDGKSLNKGLSPSMSLSALHNFSEETNKKISRELYNLERSNYKNRS